MGVFFTGRTTARSLNCPWRQLLTSVILTLLCFPPTGRVFFCGCVCTHMWEDNLRGLPACLFPRYWYYKHVPHAWLFVWLQWMELRSYCLCSRYFSNRAVSLTQQGFCIWIADLNRSNVCSLFFLISVSMGGAGSARGLSC